MKKISKLVCLLGLIISSFAFGQNIGEIHNKVLEKYYKTYGFGKINNINELHQRLLIINKELYPELFSNMTNQDVEEISNYVYGTNVDNFNYYQNTETLLKNAVDSNIISNQFRDLVIDLTRNNYDVETCIMKCNTFKESNQVSDKEDEMLSYFESVIKSSDAFWNKHPRNYSTITSRCNPKHQIRIADGCGLVFGGIAGSVLMPGLGSLLGGAIVCEGMSAFVESLIEDNGGHCI